MCMGERDRQTESSVSETNPLLIYMMCTQKLTLHVDSQFYTLL